MSGDRSQRYGTEPSSRSQERACPDQRPGYHSLTTTLVHPTEHGPLAEYDSRIRAGRLTDDEHQRSTCSVPASQLVLADWVSDIVQSLQHLHDELRDYRPPIVVHPQHEDSKPYPTSWLGSLVRWRRTRPTTQLPDNIPKGLYMYGDVGSGKTMLMDMFFDTIPSHILSKTRIHFHTFMQDVHKSLHLSRMEHGLDFDGLPFVAADIAEKGSVLCFDEFQCTDVADAMILRRQILTL